MLRILCGMYIEYNFYFRVSTEVLTSFKPPQKKVDPNQISPNSSEKVELEHEPKWSEQDSPGTMILELFEYRHSTSATKCDISPSTTKMVSYLLWSIDSKLVG